MTAVESPRSMNRLWPRSTSVLLLLVGLILSAVSFTVVVTMPDMPWHPARDAELNATYQAYRETGTLLIKETGTGSYGVQAPAPGPLTFATWDDDPGAYLVASVMGNLTNSASPYPGLTLFQAIVIALPLLWLPTAVARVVRRARAGFALILLPVVIWLINNGTLLVGTEYGLSDAVSTARVYALYGIAASLAFLSLSLLVLLSTYRLRTSVLIGASILLGVLGGFGNLARSLSGIGIAAAVGVLWWIHLKGKWRWVSAILASVVAVALALTVQTGVMAAINTSRAETTGQDMSEVPDAHTAWHSLYLGLSYPQPITGAPSRFDITWSDEFGWDQARKVDPEVLIASDEYDDIMKDLYLEKVFADPIGALKLYALKAAYLAKHFAAMLLVIVVGFAVGFARSRGLRGRLGIALAVGAPTLLLGLVPPILVMPMLYYYSELTAVLGLFTAISVGVLTWSLTSAGARARKADHDRLRARIPGWGAPVAQPVRTSVIVPASDVDQEVVHDLERRLSPDDELILVAGTGAEDTGRSADPERGRVIRVSGGAAGTGNAIRSGILASSGSQLLLVGPREPLKSGAIDLASAAENQLTEDSIHALDSGERTGGLRTWLGEAVLQSRGADGHRVLLAPGDWGRSFAIVSSEPKDEWADELVLAAELARMRFTTPPTEAAPSTPQGAGRRGLAATIRLAFRREDYREEP